MSSSGVPYLSSLSMPLLAEEGGCSFCPHRMKFRVYLVFLIILVDFLGVTILANVTPLLADPSVPGHLLGAELFNAGTAYSILQCTHALGITISPPVFGILSDRLGRRPMLLLSIGGTAVGYLFMGLSKSFVGFCLWRVVLGLFGGGRPVALAYITDSVQDPDTQATYLGYINAAPALAIGLGPAIGGLLAGVSLSFPSLFTSALALVLFLVSYFHLPESQSPSQRAVCLAGGIRLRTLSGRVRMVKASLPFPTGLYYQVYLVGFLLSFICMLCALTFPLTLKDTFQLSPFSAGLCSLGDGALFLASNAFYVHLMVKYKVRVAVLGTCAFLLWPLMLLLPVFGLGSLLSLLLFKYLTSIAGPLGFACQPQMLSVISLPCRAGELMGVMTFAQGVGRMLATISAGPLYDADPCLGYLVGGGHGLLGCSGLLLPDSPDPPQKYPS